MSKFDYKRIMPRYIALAIIMTLVAVAVCAKALYIMTAKRDYWMKVADRVKKDSVSVKPARGNILSCDGQLMASTLPEYKVFLDFQAMHESKADTLWDEKVDSICDGLSNIFPEKTPEQFREYLEEGRHQEQKNGSIGARNWPIVKHRIDFNSYMAVRQLPILNMKFNAEVNKGDYILRACYKSGFSSEEYNARQRPYGSLAERTVGEMYGSKDTARFGLELSYDSILRGTNGITHRRKVLNTFLDIMDTAPVNGADIITTLDVSMQDLAERAVIDKLKEIEGNVGVAIVMEVKTGDVKAIVNMERCADGEYREIKNHAVSDLLEPGSVFKTASLLVALDDGVCDTTYMVETGSGTWPMHGATMKDHNWHRGGYGTISLPRTLHVSSNIGVSRIIDKFYFDHPEKFVEGIYRLGLHDDLKIPLVGSSPAVIRMPEKDNTGNHWKNWSNTALAWMSIGYETQVPPISMLTFYNAIANNGRMMRPRFVKQVVKNGEVLMDFPPEVMREHIAKESTIKTMQTILEQVVSIGLGKKAGSKSFKVAGKTGTAQISHGTGGYKSGTMQYLLSFAGFFPADAPRYSCIVCIQKSGLPASGGGMSGPVFARIAEGIMAQDLKLDVKDARDSLSILMPDVKDGNILAADYVLTHLGIKTNADWDGSYSDGNPIWGKIQGHSNNTVNMQRSTYKDMTRVPNVTGMGARDAVYLLESRGVKVKIYGRGRVTKQSLDPGHLIKKGDQCALQLEV